MKYKVYKLIRKTVKIPGYYHQDTAEDDIIVLEFEGEFNSNEEAIQYLEGLKSAFKEGEERNKGEYTILPVFEMF